ncbi:MAG: DUF4430 domain-containing protein [Lachnospiraceae bacterium]|nr:DUF4430 domain-containing protein [Lachnospiraceae bacterium]
MKTKKRKKVSSFILCMVLTVAAALMTTGCNGSQKNQNTPTAETGAAAESTVLGEGSTSFALTVTDQNGNSTPFEIHTDRQTVGEALLELDLIAGDDSEYGLFVKTVNNITVDYDKDGKYWAFYIDDEYATSGVDATPITDGANYSFKVE